MCDRMIQRGYEGQYLQSRGYRGWWITKQDQVSPASLCSESHYFYLIFFFVHVHFTEDG